MMMAHLGDDKRPAGWKPTARDGRSAGWKPTAREEYLAVTVWVLRVFLGVFFAWSGVVKLLDLGAFTEAVGNYQILMSPHDAWVAHFLPWLELLAGVALVTGLGVRGGLLAIVGMLMVFLLALGMAWGRGLDISCGCFGKSDAPVNYGWKMLSNAVLLVLAAGIWWWEERRVAGGLRGEAGEGMEGV
ncbi:MAG: MauE/DoxX family redox-associated membrane protein [Verrucomicrobiales bacterium]